jgi:Ran GTPase-activating protein (RanGAP) involved in mRNA processing and transport
MEVPLNIGTQKRYSGTDLYAGGFRRLALALVDGNSTIEEIFCEQCKIDKEEAPVAAGPVIVDGSGSRALGDALGKSWTLRTLSLKRCAIDGTAAVNLANGLQSNSGLTKIDLSHNSYGIFDNATPKIFIALAKLPFLEVLVLRNCEIDGVSDWRGDMARWVGELLHRADSWDLFNGQEGIDWISKRLNASPQERTDDLRHSALLLENSTFLMLALREHFTSLRELDLSCNHLGTAAFNRDFRHTWNAILSRNTTLEILDLSDSGIDIDAAFCGTNGACGSNTTLRELRLNENSFANSAHTYNRGHGLVQILKMFKSLRVLEAGNCCWRRQPNPNSGARVDGIDILIEEMCESLVENTTLEELVLPGIDIGDAGIYAVAIAMASPGTALRKVDLNDQHISREGYEALAHAMSVNRSVVQLGVNGLGGVPAFERGRRKGVRAIGRYSVPPRGISDCVEALRRRHGDHPCNIQGLEALILAIRDAPPRPHPLCVEALACDMWEVMGLPRACGEEGWSCGRIFHEWECLRQRLIAFGMGLHTRLGGGGGEAPPSACYELGPDIFRSVGDLVFAVPPRSQP